MSRDLADAYRDALLSEKGETNKYRVLQRADVEQIPDVLYRYVLQNKRTTGTRYLLTIFLGVGGVGGALWDQEMRTLERLSGFEHPALPQLIDGGHLDAVDGDVGAAYIRVSSSPETLAESVHIRELLQTNRGGALPTCGCWRTLWLCCTNPTSRTEGCGRAPSRRSYGQIVRPRSRRCASRASR